MEYVSSVLYEYCTNRNSHFTSSQVTDIDTFLSSKSIHRIRVTKTDHNLRPIISFLSTGALTPFLWNHQIFFCDLFSLSRYSSFPNSPRRARRIYQCTICLAKFTNFSNFTLHFTIAECEVLVINNSTETYQLLSSFV